MNSYNIKYKSKENTFESKTIVSPSLSEAIGSIDDFEEIVYSVETPSSAIGTTFYTIDGLRTAHKMGVIAEGDHVSGLLVNDAGEEFLFGDGVILFEEETMFVRQDVKNGTRNSNGAYGYQYSWKLNTELNTEQKQHFKYIKFERSATMFQIPRMQSYKELIKYLKHGDDVIMDGTRGKISLSTIKNKPTNGIFVCQNEKNGTRCEDQLGSLCSWIIAREDQSMDMQYTELYKLIKT